MSTTLQTLQRQDVMNLNELASELARREQTKRDYVIDTRRASFTTVEAEGSLLTFDAEDGGVAGGPVNDWTHSQIASRLGIPRAYYSRLRTEAPMLLDANVMHWFHNKPEQRMVRTLDGKVRAFLSNRYRRLDDFDLCEHLLPVFNEVDGLNFHLSALTDTKLYIRAILPGLSREVRVGDIVQAGVEIRNSEVGYGALRVSPFIWRVDCLNGLVTNLATRTRHVGRGVEETEDAYALYRDETMRADDRAFFLKMADIVWASLDETQFDLIVQGFQEAASSEPIQSVPAATELMVKQHGLTEGEGESLITHLAAGGDLTQWGMTNAVTATAKSAANFDRLVELEELGGKVVTMTRREWAGIATATS